MELLLKLTPANDIQQHVLPMLYRGLDSDTPQIHELCLSVLPTFANLLDHSSVKNSVLPRVKKLCLSTSTLSVRVNCLLCIGRLLEHLDKWLVLDEVLPFLPQVPSREPAVLMGILGIYKLAMTHKKLGITKEVMATRILPFLIPLCIENGLNLQQFNALVALVKQMFQLVETEHRTKLEQLNSVQEQQKLLESSLPTMVSSVKPIKLEQEFSGLGLDGFTSGSLSLEEKQRIAQQQDTAKILQNQSPLKPTPIQQKNYIQTKDLTSSLPQMNNQTWFNANFSNTAMTSHNDSSMISTPSFPYNTNNNITTASGTLSSVNSFSTNSSSSAFQQLEQFRQTNVNSMLNQWPSNNNNSFAPNQRFTNTPQIPVFGNQNFSAPNVTNNAFTSNIALASSIQPSLQPTVLSPPPNNSRNKGNNLSKDEIMDLLEL